MKKTHKQLQKKNRPGFILIFGLTLVFLCMFLALYIANRGSVFVPYAKLAIEQKQAYVLAQSAAELAISTIIVPAKKTPEKDEEKNKKKPSPEQQAKELLTNILPSLNRWQTVELKEVADGIDATLKFCISCENGKFNINSFYNLENKKFVEFDGKVKAQQSCKTIFEAAQKIMGAKDLFGAFEQQIKKREWRFNDATELISEPFSQFKNALFYRPPEREHKNDKVFLMDIFTVWTKDEKINPWLMSDSVAAILDLKRAQPDDTDERKKVVAQWLKPFKLKTQWKTDWNKQLKTVYGKEYNSIPKSLQPLLNDTFDASIFSILSQATVGNTTQRLLSIVEVTASKSGTYAATMHKVYWL